MRKLFILFAILGTLSCSKKEVNIAQLLESGRWVDLTWSFDESTVYWPTNVAFSHDTVFYGINDKGYFYSSFKFSAEEHGGTHFDAPLHFARGGRSVETIPADELTGSAVVIDVSDSSSANRDYIITSQDFQKWEERYGEIPEGAIVLLKTGYGKYWGDKLMYTGTEKSGTEGVAELHFPGLGEEAANWLIKERLVKSVGIDTPSIDHGQSKDFLAHRVLCAGNITVYENIANLELLPALGSYIVAAPMKIKGGSGSPLRLLAWIPGV